MSAMRKASFIFRGEDGIIWGDMNHPKAKRKLRTQLFFIYSLMAIAVVTLVAALVLVMLGYRFNRFDGKIEQGGLVQFDSRPAGATVTLDSITLANKTASKVTAQTGDHTITMTRDGYTSWKKDVTVQAGGVLWLNYITLLPTKPTVKSVAAFPAVADSIVAPDRKYMAVLPVANEAAVSVVELNSDTPTVTKIALPADVYTAADEGYTPAFDLIGWDRDGRYMIVRHAYGDGKQEYLSVDLRGGNQAKNITRLIGLDIASVEYSLASSNTLYLLTTSHELRRADLAAATVSGPLLTGVANFAQADKSTVTYTTMPGENNVRSVGYLTTGAASPRVVRSFAGDAGVPFSLKIGEYFGSDYMAIFQGDGVEILKGAVPSSDATAQTDAVQVAKFTCPSAMTAGDFSPTTNRFVVMRCGSNVATYDLETRELARATIEGDAGGATQWIDNYHWASTADGAFAFYDFDGTNRQTVAAKANASSVAFSENSKYFYHFTTDGAQVSLLRTKATKD